MTPIPESFSREMLDILGAEEHAQLISALDRSPEVAVRLNPHKPCTLPTDISGPPVEWWRKSVRLASRPQFTLIPQLHAGAFYVQDPSSMIVGRVVAHVAGNRPMVMLDACAAPGGKTTAAIDALPSGSLMVANEYDPKRACILAENITKWGAPDVIVTRADTSRFSSLTGAFDIILADVPCSGEGMMRKDVTAREQWSPGLVRQCAALQTEILDNLWPALRPGGYLIYSTCTFNLDEDERRVLHLIKEYGAENLPLDFASRYGIRSSLLPEVEAMRFMPHLTRGEGLFMALLRKPGDVVRQSVARHDRRKKPSTTAKAPAELASWISENERYAFLPDQNGGWSALAANYLPLYEQLNKATKVLQAGVPLAIVKGRDIIPQHPLAVSQALRQDAFPAVELTEPQALSYLRCEPVTLPPDTPRGYVIVTHAGLPLGFLKNIGNRTNNLYPRQWRIRNL